MESSLIYRKVVAWTLDSSGSMGLEDITEQQIRLVWLKKSLLYMLLGSSRKKKKWLTTAIPYVLYLFAITK